MSTYTFKNLLSSKGLSVPPLLSEFGGWISKIEYGTLGYFEVLLEEVPKEWDLDDYVELQRSLLPFIHLPEGSMICLDITNKNYPIVLLGSEGGKSTLANSFEQFLMSLSNGETGVSDIDDVEDENVAKANRASLRKWLESKNIRPVPSNEKTTSKIRAISFDQLKNLFGKSMTYTDLKELSATFPGARLGAEDGGRRYMVVKSLGFDLLYERTDQSAKPKSEDYHLNTIFLYNEEVEGHKVFLDTPYGINFAWNRSELLKNMPNPERTWKIGQGAVPVSCPDPSHDRWIFDDLSASANYRKDLTIKMVVVTLRESK